MLLKSLEEKLKSDHLLLDSQIVKDRQVYDLIPVTEATEYRDDVLYISDNLKAMDKSQMPANLLWCGARLTEEDALRINWIRTEPEKLAETIACARQYILDNHAIQNLRFHIMESLLHGTEGCGLFGCGVDGIYASGCSDFSVRNTEMYDCSMRGKKTILRSGTARTTASTTSPTGSIWTLSSMLMRS